MAFTLNNLPGLSFCWLISSVHCFSKISIDCFTVSFNVVQVYSWLAKYLTELELLRTQTEFDDSLTLKIYLLQFVNYYASIFYTAFIKGKFVGRPGEYNRFFSYRQEEVS
jgi:anoctamin-1